MGKTAIEKLFDEDNVDNIVLYDENNVEQEFEQIALIPYESKIYAILRPLNNPELSEEEIAIMVIEEIDGEDFLVGVEDEKIVNAVLQAYFKLLDEEDKK